MAGGTRAADGVALQARYVPGAWRRAMQQQRPGFHSARFEHDAEDARTWLVERSLLGRG